MKDEMEKELAEIEAEIDAEKKVGYEENDNWEFEAEAPTLADTVLESDDYRIDIPAEKPVAKKAVTPPPAPEKSASKSNAPLFVFVSLVCAILIAVVVFFGYRYYNVPNSAEKMNPGNVALTVNDVDVSLGMYNYYYTCISQNYISYAQYGYYQDLDPTVDFSKQYTTDDNNKKVTWAKHFENETIEQIKFITAYYDSAVDAGVKLTSAQKDERKEQLDSIIDSALADYTEDERAKLSKKEKNNVINAYIGETYGEYCGYETLKKMLTQCYIAENYFQQSNVEQKVNKKDKQNYFKKHKDEYYSVKLAYLPIQYVEEGEGLNQKQAVDRANKLVSKIKDLNDMKKLIPEACKEMLDAYVEQQYFTDSADAAEQLAQNLENAVTKANPDEFVKEGVDWAFSKNTKVGATKVVVDEKNQVVYILLKESNEILSDEKVYSVRHILVMPETDEETEDPTEDVKYTEEQWDAAKKKADKILAEYNKTDKTEYEFAKLAEKYSEDTESTSKGSSGIYGGLCEGVPLGQMVKSFEKWSVDDSRKYGDVDIVKSKFGYHIMFFIENEESYLFDCASKIKLARQDEFVKKASVVRNKKNMKKTKVAEPQIAQSDDADISYGAEEDADAEITSETAHINEEVPAETE